MYHGAAGGEHANHGAATSTPVQHPGVEPECGHTERRDHAEPDSPDRDGERGGGCSCLGHCVGGVESPATTYAAAITIPPITDSTHTNELSGSDPHHAPSSFLLPFANAPPAAS